MRRNFALLAAGALLAMLCLPALAQSGEQPQPQEQTQSGKSGHMGRRGGMGNPDEALQHMTKQLNLTSEQQEKVRPILENQFKQMQAVRQDTSLSRQDRMSKMRSLHQDTMSQIKPLLNSDQQQKLDQMMSQRQGRRRRGASKNPQS